MKRGAHTLAKKFAHLTRADLEGKARHEGQDIAYVGGGVRRLDLLTCEELARTFSMTGGVGQEAAQLVMQKAQSFEDILPAARASGMKSKIGFLLKAVEFCSNMTQAQELYETWPKVGQGKEVLMKKVCELANTKEELASFVLRNKLV